MELKIFKLISQIILSAGMSVVAVADESSSMPSASVEFCGRLRHGVVAIGGESTGTTISAGRMIWEVQLLTDADRRFAETHHKEMVVVSGRLRKVRGVETKDRWIIEAKTLSKQDATKDQASVQIRIVGMLRAADGAAWMTIESADQVWPIDRPADVTLKIAAESLVGQPVLIVGSLKPDPEYIPGSTPLIQITSVKKTRLAPIQRDEN